MLRPLTKLFWLFALAPVIAGCAGASDILSRDNEWFSRPSRVFAPRTLALDTGPLTPGGEVGPNDLVSADGACVGVAPAAPAADANASVDQPFVHAGGFALGSTECDVVRAIGSPDNLSINGGNLQSREVVLTYLNGVRPGIYHFAGGRLNSIERAPEPVPPPRAPRRTKRRTT